MEQIQQDNRNFLNINKNEFKNLKSPINKNNYQIYRYQPERQLLLKCLPAKFSHYPIYGQLIVKIQNIILNQGNSLVSKSKNVLYRFRMLGYQSHQCPFLTDSIIYSIHTNNKMFKYYLKDMKYTIIQILDSRNYEPIGHCYINWLNFMRSIQDNIAYVNQANKNNKYAKSNNSEDTNNKYYLPFLDQQCKLNIPIYDYRIPKLFDRHQTRQQKSIKNNKMKIFSKQRIIGQLQILWLCRIYQKPIADKYQSTDYYQQLIKNNPQFSNQVTKQRMSIRSRDFPNQQTIMQRISGIQRVSISPSIKKILKQQKPMPYHQIESQIHSNVLKINNQRPSIMTNKRSSNVLDKAEKYNEVIRNSKIYNLRNSSFINESQVYENFIGGFMFKNNKGISNQLQLLQLKLDVQDFFGKNNIKEQANNYKNKDQIIMQIIKLKTKIDNLSHLDVYLTNHQKQNQFKSHFKIYKISQQKLRNQIIFKSKIVIERPLERIIQIEIPNNLGKCSFKIKDIINQVKQIFIYNKGMVVGTLYLKKYQQKNEQKIDKKQIQQKNIIKNQQIKFNSNINSKNSHNRICIISVQNFTENYNRKLEEDKYAYYSLRIKNVQFFKQTLLNSKKQGQYAVLNCQNIPNILAIQIINSDNQLVGMSQNIKFLGDQIPLVLQNIMPILFYQKNFLIRLKQMPVYKKLPSTISFKLCMYLANTEQLNYFINKKKQQKMMRQLQNNINRQKQISSSHKYIFKKPQRKIQKYTYLQGHSNQQDSINKQMFKRIATQSIQDYQNDKKQKNQISNSENESKQKINKKQNQNEGQRYNKRFKTQGNYTQDLHNRNNDKGDQSRTEQKQNLNNMQEDQQQHPEQEQIYLVQFFCKSLHFIFYKLGSKINIQTKLQELKKYRYGQNTHEQTVSKQKFQRLLYVMIGDRQQCQKNLGFDVNQILQALFSTQDNNQIKLGQFTSSLVAYFNLLLLLIKQKQNLIDQLIVCEPKALQKLSKLKQVMRNVNDSFLWDDLLPNVIQKTKNKINKRYRISPNNPFSIQYLLKDIILNEKANLSYKSKQEQYLNSVLNIIEIDHQGSQIDFMRMSSDLGNLVRQTIQQLIIENCLKNKQQNYINNKWFQNANLKIKQFIQNQKQNGLSSLESQNKEQLCFNLTQFQQLFSSLQIQISLWQSLMIIQEIKVWHQKDKIQSRAYIQTGEGILSVSLLQSWFQALKMKIQIKMEKLNNLLKINKDIIHSQLHSLKSAKSIQSDDQDLIQQINKKIKTKPQINRLITQNNSVINKNILKKASLKGSQLNNESDIANIANLLKQNQNNFYFNMDQRSFNQIQSNTNVRTQEKILKQLEQNSLFRQRTKILQNILSNNQSKFKKQSQESSKIEQQNIHIQNDLIYVEQQQIIKSQIHYLTIKLKQIKLKKKDKIFNEKGLKKLNIQLQNKKSKDSQQFKKDQIKDYKQYYFLTQQILKILFNEDISQNKSNLLIQKYILANIKIDINNLHRLQNEYKKGLIIELLNIYQKDQSFNRSSLVNNRTQSLIFKGILPVQDLIKISQDYKKQLVQNKQNKFYNKKKTIVLYTEKQINGKIIVQIQMSAEKVIYEKIQNLSLIKYTTIKLNFKLNNLFIKKEVNTLNNLINIDKNIKISISYCSVLNPNKLILIIPQTHQNEQYEINIPQPILEYQLILKTILNEQQMDKQIFYNNFSQNLSVNSMKNQQNNKESNQQCVIPLQTLFFKKKLKNQYPLIDNFSGRFICNIDIDLNVIDQ